MQTGPSGHRAHTGALILHSAHGTVGRGRQFAHGSMNERFPQEEQARPADS
ncbi:hypothetical protein [Streptomyces sp. NPDC001502]|uniref:hypothetical protein n=1 Tax=Streptomyces sp. NPDC001502 TaxID=3364578 RepID=UPI00368B9E6D